MKISSRIFIFAALFVGLSIVAFADVAFSTMTQVYFKDGGQPVTGEVDYTVKCYGYTEYPDSESFYSGEAPENYVPEEVYSYSATCPEYGCKIYESYYLNYRHLDYCNVEGTYDGESFKIENFSDVPYGSCGDVDMQYSMYDGDNYYRYTDASEKCQEDGGDSDTCDALMEIIPIEDIETDDNGNALDIKCETTFDISGSENIFSDVSVSNSNYDAIKYVKLGGLVAGYGDGTYRPSNTINRAEFLRILIESAYTDDVVGSCLTGKESTGFKDVNTTDWYAKYVCVAKENEIVSGYNDGTFKPGDPINFSEAAKIIVSTLGYDIPDMTGEWFMKYVQVLQDKKAIPASIGAYGAALTRGEMAEIIYRLKESIEDKPSSTLNY